MYICIYVYIYIYVYIANLMRFFILKVHSQDYISFLHKLSQSEELEQARVWGLKLWGLKLLVYEALTY